MDIQSIGERRRMQNLRPLLLPRLSAKPLVSVLIANYNYGRFLEEALESVLSQTYQDFEIVVCDDGSTDESRTILNDYAERHFNVKVLFQDNKGQSEALLASFRASRGEIISFLDSDDAFSRTKLAEIVNALAATPEAGLAIHRLTLIDESRHETRLVPAVAKLPSGWKAPQMSLMAPQMLWGMPPGSGLSLRRVVAESILPHVQGYRLYPDTLVQVLAPLRTSIVAIDEPLGFYRVHGQNSFGLKEFSVADLERLSLRDAELWSAWRSYVMDIMPGLPPGFPIPPERAHSIFTYACARFKCDPASRNLRREVGAGPWFASMPWAYRLFWSVAVFLPDRTFRRAVNFVYGKGKGKMIMSRVAEATRALMPSRFIFTAKSGAADRPRSRRKALAKNAREVESQRLRLR